MRIAIFLLGLAIISGCAGTSESSRYGAYHTGQALYHRHASVDLSNTELVQQILVEQYQRWKGTRYAFGGLTRNGIDCSGLVQVAYFNGLGIELPRTTKLQVELGRKVDQDELLPGDLVFFKTGFFDRHVGIYIGGDRFFHASQSKGVTLSSLKNDYWSDNYWVSKRIY